jgi:hypothetical protein
MHVCMYIYIHIYTHKHINTHKHTKHTHATHIPRSFPLVVMRHIFRVYLTRVTHLPSLYLHTYIHTYIHTCMHTYMHTAKTHMHTHIPRAFPLVVVGHVFRVYLPRVTQLPSDIVHPMCRIYLHTHSHIHTHAHTNTHIPRSFPLVMMWHVFRVYLTRVTQLPSNIVRPMCCIRHTASP